MICRPAFHIICFMVKAEDDRKLDVALIQFRRELHRIDSNKARALETLRAIEGADVVCFSEVWIGAAILEEAEIDALLSDIGEIAEAKRFHVLTGGLFVNSGGRVEDICHVVGPDGRTLCAQKKIFPSGAIGERKFCEGGDGLSLFDAAGVRCGVAVCVDMMYPEIVREMALAGAEVVFNPGNIPGQRLELWRGLAAARAAENVVFAAFVNNMGARYLDGRAVTGGSVVCGPSGDIIASAGEEETVLRASLEMWRVSDQRSRWPYIEDVKSLRERAESPLRVCGPYSAGARSTA